MHCAQSRSGIAIHTCSRIPSAIPLNAHGAWHCKEMQMKLLSALTRELSSSFFTPPFYLFTLSSLDKTNLCTAWTPLANLSTPATKSSSQEMFKPLATIPPQKETESHSPSNKSAQPKYSPMRCCTDQMSALLPSWETVNTSSILLWHGATRPLAMASHLHRWAIQTHLENKAKVHVYKNFQGERWCWDESWNLDHRCVVWWSRS